MVIVAFVAGACGGSDNATPDAPSTACKDMGGSACFQLPTAPLSNRDGAPSVLGCGAFVPTPAPAPITFSGTFLAYGTSKPIAGGSIKVYDSVDFATPIATAISATDGAYSVTYPAGTRNELFGEFSAAGFLTIFPHYVRADLSQGDVSMYTLRIATSDNIESAGLLVKEIWDPTSAVVAGTALDCNSLIVMHAAIVVSSASGTRQFVPGVSVYYGSPGAVPLAVPPGDRADTNDNGAFALFHVKPQQPLFVQMWGFVDGAAQAKGEAGLTLIGESPIHVVADTSISLNLWAK
ncbi:MAG TPA: hypothetical protein VLB44_11590 [Kofleriaceae bacterium]|nr:hypothetical protein [Kofleriaceae bacterium]